jgi:hypothetical protein
MMVSIQLWQHFSGSQTHPLTDIVWLYSEIENDMHEQKLYPVIMDLLIELGKMAEIFFSKHDYIFATMPNEAYFNMSGSSVQQNTHTKLTHIQMLYADILAENFWVPHRCVTFANYFNLILDDVNLSGKCLIPTQLIENILHIFLPNVISKMDKSFDLHPELQCRQYTLGTIVMRVFKIILNKFRFEPAKQRQLVINSDGDRTAERSFMLLEFTKC